VGAVVGPAPFAIAVHYHFVGPRESLVRLCLIVYVAALADLAGNESTVALLDLGRVMFINGWLRSRSADRSCLSRRLRLGEVRAAP
jgi:hypothetical protein